MKGSNPGEQIALGSAADVSRFPSDRQADISSQNAIPTPGTSHGSRGPSGGIINAGNFYLVIVATGLGSVGPSSEARREAFCQRNIHWECPLGLSVQCPSPADRSPRHPSSR